MAIFLVHSHFTAKRLIECVISAEEDMYPNIRVLLTIGCTVPVLPKLSVHSLACDESSHISEIGCRISGCQDLHSCTYIMTLTLMLTKSVQSLLPSTRGGCSKGASFASRIQESGKGPRSFIVQPRLVRGGVRIVGRSTVFIRIGAQPQISAHLE